MISRKKFPLLAIGAGMLLVWTCLACSRGLPAGECLDRLALHGKTDSLCTEITKRYYDSLYSWVAMGIPTVQNSKRDSFVVDGVFLNSRRDRGILFVLHCDSDVGASFDYCQVAGCELVNGTWKFYVEGLPSFTIDRRGNSPAEYMQNLRQYWRSVLERGNALDTDTCRLRDAYIDRYFADERVRHHEKFLQQR